MMVVPRSSLNTLYRRFVAGGCLARCRPDSHAARCGRRPATQLYPTLIHHSNTPTPGAHAALPAGTTRALRVPPTPCCSVRGAS
eukprot:7363664-Prymnesium_polylepis.1